MTKGKKLQSPSESATGRNQYFLAIPFWVVILLAFVGGLWPGRLTWGINHMSLFDPGVTAAIVILALLASLPPIARIASGALSRSANRLAELAGRINKQVLAVIVSSGLILILFYWRSRAAVYGDAYILLGDMSSGEDLELTAGHYLKILTIYLNRYAYVLFRSFSDWSAADVVGFTNAVGGMLGLWAVYRICRQLSTDSGTRAFLFLGSASSASLVLFFGYIENYTWALSAALWTVSFAMGFCRKQNGAAVLLITAVLAALLHLINLAVVAIALMSLTLKERPDGIRIFGVRLKHMNLGLAVGSFLAVGLSRVVDLEFFVPVLPIEGNPYSFFAADHIVDILNQIALVAPLGIGMIAITLVWAKDRRTPGSPESGLLGTVALVFLLAAVWIDPELGAPRDWDLLSFYGLPLTIWGLYRFSGYFSGTRVAGQWVIAAGVVAAITLIPNLYEKNHPDLAVARLDALLDVDPHYQVTYDEAGRCVPWAVALQKGYGDWELAIKYLKRRISAKPDSYDAYFNLADSYYYLNILDSAFLFMRRGVQIKPDETSNVINLSKIAQRMGNCSESIMWGETAARMEPYNILALTQIGVALVHCDRSAEALPYFKRAYQIRPDMYEHIVNLALGYAVSGVADSAVYYYEAALPKAPPDRRYGVCCCLFLLYVDLGRLSEAGECLSVIKGLDPGSTEIPGFEAKLAEALKR